MSISFFMEPSSTCGTNRVQSRRCVRPAWGGGCRDRCRREHPSRVTELRLHDRTTRANSVRTLRDSRITETSRRGGTSGIVRPTTQRLFPVRMNGRPAKRDGRLAMSFICKMAGLRFILNRPRGLGALFRNLGERVRKPRNLKNAGRNSGGPSNRGNRDRLPTHWAMHSGRTLCELCVRQKCVTLTTVKMATVNSASPRTGAKPRHRTIRRRLQETSTAAKEFHTGVTCVFDFVIPAQDCSVGTGLVPQPTDPTRPCVTARHRPRGTMKGVR